MPDRFAKFLLFLVLSLSIRLSYCLLFPNCHSFDLTSWRQVADILQAGGNPYHVTSLLNWPPCWMQLIFLFKKISLATHWPFDDVVRGFLILTETALSLVLYAAVIRFSGSKNAAKVLIVGIAINPIAIFQVCQHCNFDVLVGFWILLAVYLLARFQEHHESRFWLFACLALGMGALAKTVPLGLAPLLLLSVRTLRRSEMALGLAMLLGPIILSLSVIYVLAPDDIAAKVLGYRSTPGNFGFSGLFITWPAPRLLASWPRVFEIFYGSGWLVASAWLLFKCSLAPRRIISLATLMLIAIPAFGPGSGLQYIYWFMPLLVLIYRLENRPMKMLLLMIFGAAVISYTIEYALNFATYGAFLLELVQTKELLKWSRAVSSHGGETLVMLPLWALFMVFAIWKSAEFGREMIVDFKLQRRGKQVAPLTR